MVRKFLTHTVALCLTLSMSPAVSLAANVPDDPPSLPNAVASGDTTQTATVLWARSSAPGTLVFEISTKPNFRPVVLTLSAVVTDPSIPVKVMVNHLTPGTTYFYRVTAPDGEKLEGRFVTASGPDRFEGLRFGVSGDWRGELRPYPAIANAAPRKLDFFVALGDTVYADFPSDAVLNPDGSRKAQAETLVEFRAKNGEVYTERFRRNPLGRLRSSTSILATIDDHEVIDDFAGGADASTDPRFGESGVLVNETQLFNKGVQAFQEYNPLRNEFYGATGEQRTAGKRKLYRFQTYGKDAAVLLLDARSFRDAGLPPVLPTSGNPADFDFLLQSFFLPRTMLGLPQLADLKSDLLRAQADGITWKFVMLPEPIQNLGVLGASDRYEGYAAERNEILRFVNQQGLTNVVFVTADLHGTVVNNLTYQDVFFGPQIPTGAFEVVTGAAAYDAPIGPTVINIASQLGLIGEQELACYNILPIAPDAGDADLLPGCPDDKDDFLQRLINSQLAPLGYDPVGLDNSPVSATLLQGDYVAVHTYGWTEFRIHRRTQRLRVTTYGIPAYTEAELLADPQGVRSREPATVSQFVVDSVE